MITRRRKIQVTSKSQAISMSQPYPETLTEVFTDTKTVIALRFMATKGFGLPEEKTLEEILDEKNIFQPIRGSKAKMSKFFAQQRMFHNRRLKLSEILEAIESEQNAKSSP